MLEVNHLSFAYGSHQVLKDISFFVKPGKMTFLLGHNGAGKSTIFKCILGHLKGVQGQIALEGRNIRTYSIRELARHVTYIPQAASPVFNYPVHQIVLMGRSAYTSIFASPSEEDEKIAREALGRLGISHLQNQGFSQISGGERQMVLVARALAQGGRLLLMDEPTSSLDYGNQLKVLMQVKKLCEEGMSVLISSHNPQHALLFADEILAVDDGMMLAHGGRDVMTPELIWRLYHVRVTFYEENGHQFIMPEGIGGDMGCLSGMKK